MCRSKCLVPLLTSLFLTSIAVAGDAPREQSFDELFGMDESKAVEVFGATTARCLADAREDFNLALSGQDPKHSRNSAFPQLLDGGTTFWEGACYRLTLLKRLTTYRLADGTLVSGFIMGPSLQLQFSPDASIAEPIARTRFVFLEKRAGT